MTDITVNGNIIMTHYDDPDMGGVYLQCQASLRAGDVINISTLSEVTREVLMMLYRLDLGNHYANTTVQSDGVYNILVSPFGDQIVKLT